MHTLGLIFAWILVVLFTVGFLGSSLIALEGLWDGLMCFLRPPKPRGLQPTHAETHLPVSLEHRALR